MEQGDDKDQTNGGTQQTITQLQEENEDAEGKTRSEGPYGVEEPGHGERSGRTTKSGGNEQPDR